MPKGFNPHKTLSLPLSIVFRVCLENVSHNILVKVLSTQSSVKKKHTHTHTQVFLHRINFMWFLLSNRFEISYYLTPHTHTQWLSYTTTTLKITKISYLHSKKFTKRTPTYLKVEFKDALLNIQETVNRKYILQNILQYNFHIRSKCLALKAKTCPAFTILHITPQYSI